MIEFESSLVVGGDFSAAGSACSPGVARWDGRTWHEMGMGLSAGFDAGVVCFTVQAGSLIAGGGFTHSGDTELHGVARWSGTRWESLGSGIDRSPKTAIVVDLAVFRGDLFAVSSDLEPDCGQLAIDRWDGSRWTRIAMGNRPCGMFPVSEGHLAVLGDQLYASGCAVGMASALARWDGARWWPVEGGPQDCNTGALEALDGRIYVASAYCEGASLMAWDGRGWTRVGGSDPPWSGTITCMTLHDGNLVLGGDFQDPLANNAWLPGSNRSWSVIQWDGSRWQRFGAWYAGVVALTSFDGELYAGGEFDRIDGVPFHHLAQWTSTGWRPVGTGSGFDSYSTYSESQLRAFAEYDGGLVAAGFFARAGAVAAASIARWSDGAWQPLGSGVRGTVNALAVHDGELVAGGLFDQAGGIAAVNVATWDGSHWRNLGPGLTRVTCLAVHNDTLLAGTNGGVKRWDGARWQWLSLQSMMEPTSLVSHNGSLYVSAPGTLLKRETVARWNGRSWVQMNGISGVIQLVPFGSVLLASTSGGVFSWDGRVWARWDPGFGGRFDVLARHDDALFGVMSTRSADQPLEVTRQVMYWDGNTWRDTGPGLNGPVLAITSAAGHLILGGVFTRAGGIPSASIALWKGSAPPVVLPLAASMLAGAAGASPTVNPVRSALRAVTESNGNVSIEFDLAPGSAPVLLQLYDARGRLVHSLAGDELTPGHQTLHWDRRDPTHRPIARGVYFLQMRTADGVVDTRRLTLLR